MWASDYSIIQISHELYTVIKKKAIRGSIEVTTNKLTVEPLELQLYQVLISACE